MNYSMDIDSTFQSAIHMAFPYMKQKIPTNSKGGLWSIFTKSESEKRIIFFVSCSEYLNELPFYMWRPLLE